MATPAPLPDAEIAERLAGIPEWRLDGHELVRELRFRDFVEAFGFMSMVALIAERQDHHPELRNVYNEVRLAVHSHDAGGITERDFAFAERVDEALGEG